jgi:hypothetical protein
MPLPLPPLFLRQQPLRSFLALAIALLSGLPGGTADAAESTAGAPDRAPAEVKRFDIPAGEAFSTLKRFSTQSGEQLIYKADALEGVRTAAVAGRFTSLDALGRMLARTELLVTQDPKTGTLAITRTAGGGIPNGGSDTNSSLTSSAKKKSPSP